jgi:hypothetical protein
MDMEVRQITPEPHSQEIRPGLQDTVSYTPPARMEHRDDGSGRIEHEDRDAIGHRDPHEDPWGLRDVSVRLGGQADSIGHGRMDENVPPVHLSRVDDAAKPEIVGETPPPTHDLRARGLPEDGEVPAAGRLVSTGRPLADPRESVTPLGMEEDTASFLLPHPVHQGIRDLGTVRTS